MDKRVEAIGLGLLTTVVPLLIGYAVSGPVPTASPAVAMSRRQRRVARPKAVAGVEYYPGKPVEGDVCIYPPTGPWPGSRMTSPIRNIIERLSCPLGGGSVVSKATARSRGYNV